MLPAKRLSELEIPHQPIPFQATHEVDQFATDLDQQLANTLLVVNNGVEFSATQAYFFDALANQFPGTNSGRWHQPAFSANQICRAAAINTSIHCTQCGR